MYVLLPLLDRLEREGGMRSTVTRRELLHGGIAAGIASRLNLIGSDAAALELDPAADAVPGAFDGDGRLRYRTDALAKVTGEKTFSRDFRARDLPGWPVALLIYREFARYDTAKRRLRFNDKVVRYGAVTGPKPPPHYGAARFVRLQKDEPEPDGRYSPILDATIFGKFEGDEVVWPAPDRAGNPAAKGMAATLDIEREIGATGDDALVLKREYFSQSVDASALEADNGLVRYDETNRALHILVSTQSPYEGATGAAEMLAKTNFRVDMIDFNIGHTVGYGTKDHYVFPYFCIVAGLYSQGRPVRLANDRYEQFQVGMK